MSLDNTQLYNSKSSIMDSYWHLLTLDNETQRLVDYLYQKYKLPNCISYGESASSDQYSLPSLK